MISGKELVFRYSLFAVIATAANIGAQWCVFQLYDGPFAFTTAMLVGTVVGLVIKYALDKRWIFYDTDNGVRAHGQKFMLYSTMGLATTLIFWGSEIGFELLFDHPAMKYVGAVLGLSIGYVTKYYLDRQFVFRRAAA